MGPEKTDAVVIGEGITGLCTAYWLKKRGIKTTVLAKDSEPGGTMKSVREEGFLSEAGANTGLETTPLLRELVEELRLQNEFIYANPEGDNRYILRGGILRSLPMGPVSFLTTKLFSTSAKIRFLKEPFIGRASEEESVAEFVERRLGREFLDYAIDPFVAGTFAGKPELLSVSAAFPKLYALEEKYGGLIKGMIKGAGERKKRKEVAKDRAKTFSFINGMQVFPKAIADTFGGSIIYNAKVTGLRDLAVMLEETPNEPGSRRYMVEYLHNAVAERIEADVVVFAVPAYDAATIIKALSVETSRLLSSIYYSPIVSVFLGAKSDDIGRRTDGFGFLVPSKEKRRILGCLWNSSLFPGRAPSKMTAINAFIGGARQPELAGLDDDRIVQVTLDELKSIMQFSGKPVYLRLTRWKKSIPQYGIGHRQKMEALARFEESQPGIVLAGNYRGGISVGDCVKNSYEIASSIGKNFFDQTADVQSNS